MGKKRRRRHKHHTPPPKKKTKRWKKIFINFILFLVLLIGLALVFNGQIKNFIVSLMSKDHQISTMTPKEVKENNEKDADFNFEAVESLDLETVVRARLYENDVAVIGGIAVPSVNINLPIIKGVSNYTLAIGAGTMKPDQEMGKGNYALAGHHMINKTLLFSPLTRAQKGELIYLTDLENVFIYKISYMEYVAANRSDLIEDVPDKVLVTLVTCDATGVGRLVIQGDFIEKIPYSSASTEIVNSFNSRRNTS